MSTPFHTVWEHGHEMQNLQQYGDGDRMQLSETFLPLNFMVCRNDDGQQAQNLKKTKRRARRHNFPRGYYYFFFFFFFFYFTQIKILSTQEHWTSYPSSLPADMVGFLFEALVNQLLPCLILYGGSSFDILARCVTVSYQIILIYRILKAKRM